MSGEGAGGSRKLGLSAGAAADQLCRDRDNSARPARCLRQRRLYEPNHPSSYFIATVLDKRNQRHRVQTDPKTWRKAGF